MTDKRVCDWVRLGCLDYLIINVFLIFYASLSPMGVNRTYFRSGTITLNNIFGGHILKRVVCGSGGVSVFCATPSGPYILSIMIAQSSRLCKQCLSHTLSVRLSNHY